MSTDSEVRVSHSMLTGTTEVLMSLNSRTFRDQYIAKTLEHAALLVAKRFVAENYSEIAKHIDPQAVSNLAIATAAKDICKAEIEARPPRVEHHTTLIDRGFFSTRVTKL